MVERSIGDLDIAVLRIPTPATAPRSCLPVPETTFTEDELSGAAVNLIHGSIACSLARIRTCPSARKGPAASSTPAASTTAIHYDVGTYKGDSGAALLLSGKRVIGLHSAGFNDLEQAQSESSPSTAADAVRLDLPEVRAAVQQAGPSPSPPLPRAGGYLHLVSQSCKSSIFRRPARRELRVEVQTRRDFACSVGARPEHMGKEEGSIGHRLVQVKSAPLRSRWRL